MNNNQNRIISYKELNSQRSEKNEKKSTSTSIKALGLVGLATAGIVIGLWGEKPTQFSESTKTHTFEQGEGLNAAAFDVDRTDPKIPYIEVVEHIKDMPENAKALSDGIQAGETITIPETASK